jgi:hypothetical protein
MGQLVLKRALASRSSGEWSGDDYDVLADGAVVGSQTLTPPCFTLRAARLRRLFFLSSDFQAANYDANCDDDHNGCRKWRVRIAPEAQAIFCRLSPPFSPILLFFPLHGLTAGASDDLA